MRPQYPVALAFALVAVLTLLPQQQMSAQAPQRKSPYVGSPIDGWTLKPIPPLPAEKASAPAPRRDLSGIWDPGNGGIQAMGSANMPEDGKPEHELPYTPAGLAALKLTKPTNGVRSVLPADTNDASISCDPQGMPREDLFEIRTTQILQTPTSVVLLYEFNKVWRTVWTDGRSFPERPAPRWYGYSIGKWEDDYTLVVTTWGTDDRTWVDRAGRPHSADLRVEERFHRVDYGNMELTVIINDPKMYTKPWVAMDKLKFKLQPNTFDITEMICSTSELAEFNKFVGSPASNDDKDKK
jgi:hypothetical protein